MTGMCAYRRYQKRKWQPYKRYQLPKWTNQYGKRQIYTNRKRLYKKLQGTAIKGDPTTGSTRSTMNAYASGYKPSFLEAKGLTSRNILHYCFPAKCEVNTTGLVSWYELMLNTSDAPSGNPFPGMDLTQLFTVAGLDSENKELYIDDAKLTMSMNNLTNANAKVTVYLMKLRENVHTQPTYPYNCSPVNICDTATEGGLATDYLKKDFEILRDVHVRRIWKCVGISNFTLQSGKTHDLHIYLKNGYKMGYEELKLSELGLGYPQHRGKCFCVVVKAVGQICTDAEDASVIQTSKVKIGIVNSWRTGYRYVQDARPLNTYYSSFGSVVQEKLLNDDTATPEVYVEA